MKSLKTIIIAGIVLVVFVIASVVVVHMPNSSDAQTEVSAASM